MIRHLSLAALLITSACGPHYVVPSRETGGPFILVSSAYTQAGCIENLHEEAERLRVGLKLIHVKGSFFGRSLIWPFYKGYTCSGTVSGTSVQSVSATPE